VDVVEHDLGLEALGVLLHARHQVRAQQAVGVARPVVDVGGGHQLAALLQAGDDDRLEVGAGDSGRPAGRAGAEDQQRTVRVGRDASWILRRGLSWERAGVTAPRAREDGG
jgi:hypothetical protein